MQWRTRQPVLPGLHQPQGNEPVTVQPRLGADEIVTLAPFGVGVFRVGDVTRG